MPLRRQQHHHHSSSSRRRHTHVKRNRGWMAVTTTCYCFLIMSSIHWNTSLAFTTIQQKTQAPIRRPLSFTQRPFQPSPHRSSPPLPLSPPNTNNSPIHPKRPTLPRLILPLLLTILPLPALAMGPNLRGPVIEKEVRGMERARIMAAEKARADAIAEKQRLDEESSRVYREKGPKAHAAFMEQYEADVKAKEAKRVEERDALIERLVCDEGVNPWRSLKGKAILYEFDTGIDLYEVPGTEQEAFANLARVFPEKYDGNFEEKEKEKMLEEVTVLVDEGKTRGEIVTHFKREGEKLAHFMNTEMGRETMKLRALREKKRMAQSNVKKEDNDNIAVAPTETTSATEAETTETPQEDPAAALVTLDKSLKEEMKRKKQQAKADAKAARDEKREQARQAKKLAAEAKAAKKLQDAAKKSETTQALESPASETTTDEATLTSNDDDVIPDDTPAELPATTAAATTPLGRAPKLIAASTVIAGSGLVTIRMMKQNAQKKEEERQKQFKLLMGIDNDKPAATATPTTTTTPPAAAAAAADTKPSPPPTPSSPPASSTPTPPPPPKKTKKKRGLGSIFRPTSTSTRPTSLPSLLSSSTCPPLSHLLSQILSSQGAPGRFPSIPPPDTSYATLDDAAKALTELREENDLTVEQTGEMFADVVSCLIIEIIDLASGALEGMKEGDEGGVVVEGMNVVLDFMDYAAGLFGLVAPGVTLSPPVTYGGSLSKSKLERMYALYATSAMTSLASSDSDRVDILQQVLNISDKRSEALMQKFMMKNLMKMMKDGGKGMMGGEGGDMAGLAEMMKGLEGMEGMGGEGDFEMGEEEIKQSVAMMKQLVDSGSITKEEIGLVKEQFRQAYGEDIEDLIKQADEGDVDELGDDGKELLDLFKTVLKEE